jgi:AcrR family transcriptional regulator
MAVKNEEKVIQAGRQVFQRYGFKRVTMGDIAEAAGMSRPALYLVFPSKEEILSAVVAEVFAGMLEEIRHGIRRLDTPEEKLTLAFDVWCVRPFEMVQQSPDAKDLYESTLQFATEVTTRAFSEFEALVAQIIHSVTERKVRRGLSAVQIAHILASAMAGFKSVAKNTAQLRELIAGLIAIVLLSLN